MNLFHHEPKPEPGVWDTVSDWLTHHPAILAVVLVIGAVCWVLCKLDTLGFIMAPIRWLIGKMFGRD